MNLRTIVKRSLEITDQAANGARFLPPLITRIVVGVGFFVTGTGKWQHIDRVAQFFQSLHIPQPELQAKIVATLEVVGGLCILAGLLTRFFSAALAVTMVVALNTADNESILSAFLYLFGKLDDDMWTMVPTDVTAFGYLVLLAWLAAYGAGALSIDRLLRWAADRFTAARPGPLTRAPELREAA